MYFGRQSPNRHPAKTPGSSLARRSHADSFSSAHPARLFRPTAQSHARVVAGYILAPHQCGPNTTAAQRLIALPSTLPTTAHAAHNRMWDRFPTPRRKPASAAGPTALPEDRAMPKSTRLDSHDAYNNRTDSRSAESYLNWSL